MCNLYDLDTGLDAIRAAMGQLTFDLSTEPATGNFAGRPRLYPDQDGVVIHAVDDGVQLSEMRWGFPPAGQGKSPITNIRNLASPWWRRVNGAYLMQPEYRCLVPFRRFAEPIAGRRNAWFAVPGRDVAFFAGVWRPWQGERLAPVAGKSRRQRTPGDWRLYAFLTCEPNDVVAPIHPKAMPVILTDPEDCRAWLAGGEGSLALQRPLPDDQLEIVERDPG
ncbi:SOS response-associated peptidase [Maricaulis maris]|uniref:Putative SOS response-associated peptidase YedK n=1 Tax=Maricaulis maris TaxID=74318 RepID=A0A495DJA1_9PROT|nr:SOS response-associated peptidase family protein [Maricaulis maris]RKR02694.1 putative SOS response-associated peptidase YedK [Maricaulis maris]